MGSRNKRVDLLTTASVAVAVLFAAPLLYLIVRNATHPSRLVAAVVSPRTLVPLGRSLLLGTSVAVGAATVGTVAAWLVVRSDLPGRTIWRAVLPLPLVIPSFIAAFALLAAFGRSGLFGLPVTVPHGFWGALVVMTLLTFPYVLMPVAARLGQLPPSLEEASRLLGRRPRQVFWSVVWPQLRGAVFGGALLAFLYVVSDFGAVQLLQYRTITGAIYANRLLDSEVSLALALELGFVAIAVVAAERIVLRRTKVVPGDASVRPLRVRLGAWKPVALIFVGLLAAMSLVAPLLVLGYWALRGPVGDATRLVTPMISTAAIGIATAIVSVIVVAPVAWLTVRRRSRTGEAANAIILAGFALPGLPLALALVFFTVRAPWPVGALYQTLPLLVFAYLVHFGALGLRTSQEAVGSVPLRLDEAARSLGAGRWRRLASVDVPIMAPGLLAAGALVLLSTMKELPATLLLSPPGFQTLATKIWGAAEEAFFAEASLASLVLVALSGVLTWVFVVRHGTRRDEPPTL